MVSAGQINAVVPYEVATAGGAGLSIEVKYLGQSSNAFPITLATTAPGVFTANMSGTGQAAAVQYDPTGVYRGVNSAANPATKGWYLVLYMTGDGVLNPAAKTGAVTGITLPLEQPFYAPSVLIDNQPAFVSAYAEAPTFVSGMLQVNAIVPQTTHTGAVSLVISLGGGSSQAGVTVALQ
jgi:uncharacterized protein (TIGR03437 family)